MLLCMLWSMATAISQSAGELNAGLAGMIREMWSANDVEDVDRERATESQIRDVLWTVKTADTPKTWLRLQHVLGTWYRMIPPEQFALVVGVPGGEQETRTAALLSGVHPDSMVRRHR